MIEVTLVLDWQGKSQYIGKRFRWFRNNNRIMVQRNFGYDYIIHIQVFVI